MKKEFCTYKQALALKELGFNELCFTTYDDEGRLRNPFDYERSEYEKTNISYIEDSTQFLTNESLNSKSNFIIAPLKQQAFRWFREKHGLYSVIDGLEHRQYYKITQLNSYSKEYDTYEEAEQACLDKLIETLWKKNL